MIKVLMYIGAIFGVLGAAVLTGLIIVFISDWVDKRVEERRKSKNIKNFRKLSATFAVRVPTKTQFFTPVAYVYGRSGRDPVVTILNQTFFRKLPDQTSVFVLEADKKSETITVETVGDIRQLLTAYTKSIKKAWEI